jgi:hypothetical protein
MRIIEAVRRITVLIRFVVMATAAAAADPVKKWSIMLCSKARTSIT